MKSRTTILLESGLLKKARKIAKSERRSLSAQIETWLNEAIGEAPADPKADACVRKGNGKKAA